VINIFRTMARHPKLMKRGMVFANHVLGGSTLPARERERVILRTGYLCGSGYEWAQHVAIARAVKVLSEGIIRWPQYPTTSGGGGCATTSIWTSSTQSCGSAGPNT
jgi:4-carboxymuconolactone decarboxylase